MLFKRCDFYNKLFILRFYYVCMFLNTWIYWGFKKPTVKSSSPKHCETGETKLCLLVFSSVKWVMVRPRESPSSLMLDDHVLLFLNLRHDIGLYFKQGCYWGSLFGGRKKKPNYLFLILLIQIGISLNYLRLPNIPPSPSLIAIIVSHWLKSLNNPQTHLGSGI